MTHALARDLTARLTRPQRLGVFGHRGVGKTTLLTVLYREAAGGRLPGLRLAAADARTASYLADRIVQLESGEPLPATLDETELRFHLYHDGSRVELVVLDYQGEHVALGRHEPVRDFLRGCDAIWLCLDAPLDRDSPTRWQAEQEIEQVVEDYLADERQGVPHRPMALVVTKADLLGDAGDVAAIRELVDQSLAMTRHALHSHCPWQGVFAVSSHDALPTPVPFSAASPAVPPQRPAGLTAPLTWLVQALREQDHARLEQLWRLAPREIGLLEQATRTFARRYPDDPRTRPLVRRLAARQWRQRGRRMLAAGVVCLAVLAGLWGYDARGAARLTGELARTEGDPAAQWQAWRAYQTWYPTRYLFRSSTLPREREQTALLEREVRLAELRRRAEDPDADPEAAWADFLRFREDWPEYDLEEMDQGLRARMKSASDRQRAERERREKEERDRQARGAFRELEKAEVTATLTTLLELSGRLAKEHAGTEIEPEILRRRAVYLRRLDERDFEEARDYSRRNPTNFFTRRQRYRQYLDRHPEGAHASEARVALRQIVVEWDRHDFRAIAEQYTSKPGEVRDLRALCRAYLTAHPEGRYRTSAEELIRFCDRVVEPRDYKVVLRSGSFTKKVAHLLSRGAYLSVEIEVGGIRYGPSTIVRRSYDPEWDYEFPRKIRWKLGESVRVVLIDNYYWKRRVGDVTFDDPLALRHLTGEVELRHGTLTFSSDFTLPKLPKIE